jgi:hypothetical protein
LKDFAGTVLALDPVDLRWGASYESVVLKGASQKWKRLYRRGWDTAVERIGRGVTIYGSVKAHVD